MFRGTLPDQAVWAECSDRFPLLRPKSIMKNNFSSDQAEALAVQALIFLANDPELLPRFLSLTGITAGDIRTAAQEPGFLAGVLQFYLAHEPTLLRFCEETGTDPMSFQIALNKLPGGAVDEQF